MARDAIYLNFADAKRLQHDLNAPSGQTGGAALPTPAELVAAARGRRTCHVTGRPLAMFGKCPARALGRSAALDIYNLCCKGSNPYGFVAHPFVRQAGA